MELQFPFWRQYTGYATERYDQDGISEVSPYDIDGKGPESGCGSMFHRFDFLSAVHGAV